MEREITFLELFSFFFVCIRSIWFKHSAVYSNCWIEWKSFKNNSNLMFLNIEYFTVIPWSKIKTKRKNNTKKSKEWMIKHLKLYISRKKWKIIIIISCVLMIYVCKTIISIEKKLFCLVWTLTNCVILIKTKDFLFQCSFFATKANLCARKTIFPMLKSFYLA